MPYRIKRREPMGEAVRRIARQEIDKAIRDLTTAPELHHIGVHEARKRFKKLRSLLRLLRDPLGKACAPADAFFRDLGQRLAAARDAEAIIEAFDLMVGESDSPAEAAEQFAALRGCLGQRRDELVRGQSDLDQRMDDAIAALRPMRRRIARWRLGGGGFDVVAPGLARCYRAGRDAMSQACEDPTEQNFHDWRKHVKDHWHHVRLLRGLWPAMMTALAMRIDDLAEALGHDHDLSVLRHVLESEPQRFAGDPALPALLAMIGRRQAVVRRGARPLGERIYAETPRRLVKRLAAYWAAWHRKGGNRHSSAGAAGAPAIATRKRAE